MIVKRLIVKNWRNFQQADVLLRERQFIVGPNASGKSNLLDIVLLFAIESEFSEEVMSKESSHKMPSSCIKVVVLADDARRVLLNRLKLEDTE